MPDINGLGGASKIQTGEGVQAGGQESAKMEPNPDLGSLADSKQVETGVEETQHSPGSAFAAVGKGCARVLATFAGAVGLVVGVPIAGAIGIPLAIVGGVVAGVGGAIGGAIGAMATQSGQGAKEGAELGFKIAGTIPLIISYIVLAFPIGVTSLGAGALEFGLQTEKDLYPLPKLTDVAAQLWAPTDADCWRALSYLQLHTGRESNWTRGEDNTIVGTIKNDQLDFVLDNLKATSGIRPSVGKAAPLTTTIVIDKPKDIIELSKRSDTGIYTGDDL